MSLGPALDVAIGLMFIYLLLGLLTSAVQEIIAGWINKRGTVLRDAIAQLLTGATAAKAAANPLFVRVSVHALVRGAAPKRFPSYVDASNFVLALIDSVSDGSGAPAFTQIEHGVARLPNGPAKDAITALVMDAAGNLDKLKTSLGTWFDGAMARVSGEYKRYTHAVALMLGLAIAIGLNVDSIKVGETLWRSQPDRDALVATTQKFMAAHNSVPSKDDANELLGQINDLSIPMGWPTPQGPLSAYVKSLLSQIGFLTIVGWLITALAVSLGAPFWFDTLQRIFNLRSTGPKPAPTDDPA